MSILLRRPLIASLVGALLALAIVAGVAYANTLGEPEQSFTGCLDLVTDRVTDIAVGDEPAFTECDDGYQEVSWKAEAVIVGTDGERGEPGEAGPPGTDGERGDIGPMGLIGPTGTPGAFGPVGAPGLSGARGADGRDGKDGAAGLAGTNGTDGTDGTDGNLIASGTGPPPPDSGNVGDLYLDDAEGRLFGPKTEAGWGSGLVLTGDSGNKILSGSGAPPGDFGGIGDMYLDEAAGDLYGPKGMLGWGTGFTLVGPPGSVVLSGSTPPDGSLGLTGDMYLDTAAGQLYGPKTDANGWGTALQITGADGNKILSAEQPPAVGDGEIGDLYLDRSTSELYGPKTAAGWGDPVSLAGAPGSAVLSGNGTPQPELGNAGDFYIDVESPRRFLYGPKSPTTWLVSAPVPLVGDSALAPAGSVIFFDGTACPATWSAVDEARGRMIVGLNPNGTPGGTVGVALDDLEAPTHTHSLDVSGAAISPAGDHAHAVAGTAAASPLDEIREIRYYAAVNNGSAVASSNLHSHTVSGSTNTTGSHTHAIDIPAATSGTPGEAVVPYLQLLVCRKD